MGQFPHTPAPRRRPRGRVRRWRVFVRRDRRTPAWYLGRHI